MNRPELPILLGMAGLILGAILVREPEAPRWLQSGTTRLIVYLWSSSCCSARTRRRSSSSP
jgi:hypothetical protein